MEDQSPSPTAAPEPHDGGAAFPFTYRDGYWSVNNPGMTLRDYFAAKTLAAIISNEGRATTPESRRGDCACAYQIADAMLAARGAA